MSALVDRLTELQSAWADSVCPWKDDPVQPEVLQARRDYPEDAGGIVYNADVARVVIERHAIPDELRKCLDAQVYLSQQVIRGEKRTAERETMEAEGWAVLTPEKVNELEPGTRIILKRGGKDAEPVNCRVILGCIGIGLLPGRNRTRGLVAASFISDSGQSFYKAVTA